MITIDIIFAAETRIWQQSLTLDAGSTIEQALAKSQLFIEYPQAKQLAVGIFGELCQPNTVLADKDRIEVYRQLVFDPMDSRRRRAAHRAAQSSSDKQRRKPSAAASMIWNRSQ